MNYELILYVLKYTFPITIKHVTYLKSIECLKMMHKLAAKFKGLKSSFSCYNVTHVKHSH